MTTHTITLARHTAQVVGLMGVLVLGTWDSYGTEQLLLRHGPEWEGLAIDATFHNVPNDEGVTVLADTDGLVTVPPEACMRASKYATITFRGVQDGVQRISCNLPYMVLDHAQVPGANSTATPSENAQALAQMQDLRDGAVDAKKHAEAARDDAANSAVAAKESEISAGQSATAAKTAQSAAETAKAGAETAQKAAASSASSASTFASTATTQAAAAKASEVAATKSAKEAAASAANLDSAANTATQKAAAASASAAAAKASESAAASSEAAARKYANSAESAAKTAGEAATEKLQQMQAIQDDVTAKQAQTATDATAAEKAKVAAEAAQKDAAASKAAAANSAAAAKTSEYAAAKSAADADSTANSINNSMMQIAANKEAVSQLKEDTTALQKRQNVLVGSETGNPIDVDDAFAAPLCGLTIYGRSTQDGAPAPDAPVPIVSAGDSGTIVLTLGDGDGKTQTLTLPTPNGLPGIPVTSGGNYTDQNGQQWVCDEVDLGRGVKVQRVNAVDLSTCVITGITSLAATKRLAIRLPLNGRDYKTEALCNKLQFVVSFTKDTPHFYIDISNAQVFIPIGTKNPEEGEYILFYALSTPIETPLTPAEIAAYKALTAYAPDTVVQASDGAGVKLEYQRDVNIAIKKLEDAIASMTAT